MTLQGTLPLAALTDTNVGAWVSNFVNVAEHWQERCLTCDDAAADAPEAPAVDRGPDGRHAAHLAGTSASVYTLPRPNPPDTPAACLQGQTFPSPYETGRRSADRRPVSLAACAAPPFAKCRRNAVALSRNRTEPSLEAHSRTCYTLAPPCAGPASVAAFRCRTRPSRTAPAAHGLLFPFIGRRGPEFPHVRFRASALPHRIQPFSTAPSASRIPAPVPRISACPPAPSPTTATCSARPNSS